MADIHIIDNYKDLMLGDHEQILAVLRDDTLEELDKQVKIISILTKLSEDTILDLPIMEYKRLAMKSEFLRAEITDKFTRIADSYKIGKFDLVPVKDIRKLTTAQYIDFQTLHQAGMEEHFPEIISVLLVPKGKKYNQDYDIVELHDALRKNLSVYDAMCLYGFFVYSSSELIKDILTYSLEETKNIKDKEKREEMQTAIKGQMARLERSGDGLPM